MLFRLWVVSSIATIAFAQSFPNPAFQETAVIPSFHRRNREIVNFKTVFKKPIDEEHLLLVVRGGAPLPGWNAQPEELFWNESDFLGIFLMEAGDSDLVWELAIMPGPEYGGLASIARADSDSIVFQMTHTDYRLPRPWLKVFFDAAAKRSTGQKWYTPPAVSAIAAAGEESYFVAQSETGPLVFLLSGDSAQLVEGERLERALVRAQAEESTFGSLANGEFAATVPSVLSPFGPGDGCRCDECPVDEKGRWHLGCTRRLAGSVVDTVVETGENKKARYRLSSTSFEEFAAARPERVKQGYGRDAASLVEQIGPYQLDGDRLWFAKLFYDGEGLTGVGGLGYFDLSEKRFTLFAPPEIAGWSASAILVEEEAVWVGLVGHPEGATYSGDLLRFDRAGERAEVFPIPDTILELKSSESGILAGTSNGLYIVRPEGTLRISIEPDAKGHWQALRTEMPGRKVRP